MIPKALLAAAVLCALCPSSAPSAFAQDPKPDPAAVKKEKEDQKARVKAVLDAFAKDYKNNDPDARAGAVLSHLGSLQDPKTLERAAGILGGEHEKVKIAACEVLGRFKDDPRLNAAAASALLPAIGMNKKNNTVVLAVFKALGDLGNEAAASELHKWIDDNDTPLARAAIDAVGKIRARSSIPELIKLAQKLDRANGSLISGGRAVAGGGYNQAAAAQQEAKKRYDDLYTPAMTALGNITRQSIGSAGKWEEWWKKNQSTFIVPGKEPKAAK